MIGWPVLLTFNEEGEYKKTVGQWMWGIRFEFLCCRSDCS
jgi:hypothetical protein